MAQAVPSRVLLIISCFSGVSTGQGGFYYTVRDLALAFSSSWPTATIQVLVVGDVFPLPLRDDRLRVAQVDFSGKSIGRFTREVLLFGDEFSPTHVHSFDNKSHFFGRWIARRTTAKVFLTRPGGPNSKVFFPYAPHIVCFSEENLNHLSSRRNLRSTDFHLLPQRVAIPPQDVERMDELRRIIGDDLILLRICRIGTYYRKSILQTLALAQEARAAGLALSAVIIGVVQDEAVHAEIQTLKSHEDFVITDPHFTVNASRLISVAQAVVGTGRSLVEAALLGKVLLTPLSDSDKPVLVTEENWRELASTNFSERNRLGGDRIPSFSQTIDTIISGDKAAAVAIASEMGIDAAIPAYENIYNMSQHGKPRPVDFALNSAAMTLRYLRTKAASTPRRALSSARKDTGASSSMSD